MKPVARQQLLATNQVVYVIDEYGGDKRYYHVLIPYTPEQARLRKTRRRVHLQVVRKDRLKPCIQTSAPYVPASPENNSENSRRRALGARTSMLSPKPSSHQRRSRVSATVASSTVLPSRRVEIF